jgi:antitoxin PrlF
MNVSTVTAKGQTTIPQEVRKYLHLQTGDRINFVINADGKVFLIPATVDSAELKGILPLPKKPVSIKQMNKAISNRGGKKC